MAPTMPPLTAGTPLLLEVVRKGGSIIGARFDFWRTAAPGGLAGSKLLQSAKLAHEVQQLALPPGQYDCVLTVWVEESLNGVFSFQVKLDGQQVGAAHGNVNNLRPPDGSRVLHKQFPVLVAEGS
jgi:hypothetical protein